MAKTLAKNNSIYFKPKPEGSQLLVEYNGLELYNDVITSFNITLKSVMRVNITNCNTETMNFTYEVEEFNATCATNATKYFIIKENVTSIDISSE